MGRAIGSKEGCGNCGEWVFLCGCTHETELDWAEGEEDG